MAQIKKFLRTIDIVLLIILIFTTYLSFSIGSFHYVTTTGPDFDYYKNYFYYFYGELENSGIEQGLIYFFSTSYINTINSEFLNSINYLEFLSNSIQLTNFIYYLIGMYGLYYLLKFYNYENKVILIVLNILNFFPPIYEARLLYKPEIIIFPTLVWLINFLNKYIETKDLKYLFYSISPLIILLTSKANTALMILLFLLIFYFRKVYITNIKNFYLLFFLFLITYFFISIENFISNGLLLFQHNLPIGFDNKADFSFLFNLDIQSLYVNPFRHTQKNSFIGIVLLDTFNDYFTISWNDDSSIFFLDQIGFLSIKFKPFLSIFFTCLIYFLFIKEFISNKKQNLLLLAPFVGIVVQMIISQFTGYNPETGDIAKTYYYSFFLAIAFSLLIAENLKKYLKLSVFFILIFISSMVHIIGFPKYESSDRESFINFNNQIGIFCEVNNLIYKNLESDCVNYSNICDYYFDSKIKTFIVNSKYITEELFINNPNLIFSNKNNNDKNITTKLECNELIDKDWKLKKYNNIKNYPMLNITILIFFLISIFSYPYLINKDKLKK